MVPKKKSWMREGQFFKEIIKKKKKSELIYVIYTIGFSNVF